MRERMRGFIEGCSRKSDGGSRAARYGREAGLRTAIGTACGVAGSWVRSAAEITVPRARWQGPKVGRGNGAVPSCRATADDPAGRSPDAASSLPAPTRGG